MHEEIYGRHILISVNAKEVYGIYMKQSERIAISDRQIFMWVKLELSMKCKNFFLKFVLILNYAFPDLLNTTSTTFIVDAIVEMQERDAISSYRNRNFLSFQLRSLFITLSPIHFSPHESLIILELDVEKLWNKGKNLAVVWSGLLTCWSPS